MDVPLRIRRRWEMIYRWHPKNGRFIDGGLTMLDQIILNVKLIGTRMNDAVGLAV